MNAETEGMLASSTLSNQAEKLHAYDSGRTGSDQLIETEILAECDIIRVSLNLCSNVDDSCCILWVNQMHTLNEEHQG